MDNASKELKATVQLSIHVTTERSQTSSAPVSQMLQARKRRLEQMMSPVGTPAGTGQNWPSLSSSAQCPLLPPPKPLLFVAQRDLTLGSPESTSSLSWHPRGLHECPLEEFSDGHGPPPLGVITNSSVPPPYLHESRSTSK